MKTFLHWASIIFLALDFIVLALVFGPFNFGPELFVPGSSPPSIFAQIQGLLRMKMFPIEIGIVIASIILLFTIPKMSTAVTLWKWIVGIIIGSLILLTGLAIPYFTYIPFFWLVAPILLVAILGLLISKWIASYKGLSQV